MIAIKSSSLPLISALLLALTLTAPSLAKNKYRLDDKGRFKPVTLTDPATPQGQLQSIRKALAEDDPRTALKLVKKWFKQHPDHKLTPEAHLLRGDALVAKKQYYKALFDYEALIRVYPESEQYATAIAREYEIARLFASGVKRRLGGLAIISATSEAEELFIRTQERLPGSELGEQASLALGDLYFDRGEMGSATLAYDLFLENYPRSSYRERAMLQLIYASLATFKGPAFDPTGLLEAGQRIEQFASEFPASAARLGATELQLRIKEMLAAKQLNLAQWYERRGERVSAIYLYKRIGRDHPNTPAASKAKLRLAALQGPANPPPAVPRVKKKKKKQQTSKASEKEN
jgi:outer membrane assembly lipoprotein YfiO